MAPTFVARSGETWRDPWPMYADLRDHDPVHHAADAGHWVLSRFGDVWGAARDTSSFSSADGLTVVPGERERIGLDEAVPLVMTDPPDHTDLRRLVSRPFTPRRVAELEDMVRAFVRERLEDLVAAGGGDVIASVFKPLPSMVVAHFLGVPAADRSRFDTWTGAIVEANADGDVRDAAEHLDSLLGYFSDLVERRRHDPGDDVISDLVHVAPAERGADGAAEDGAEGTGVPVLRILGFAFTMVAGGNDTTTGLLGGAAELLTERTDQRARLLADPALIGPAVDELLRLTSPVQGLARTTTREVTLHGTTIPAGEKVLLLYGAANRDPREFGADAGELDVGRPIDRLVAFGQGAHHCLGAAAARLQGRVALEELLRLAPGFAVDASAGTFAPGNYVRRFSTLPFDPGALG